MDWLRSSLFGKRKESEQKIVNSDGEDIKSLPNTDGDLGRERTDPSVTVTPDPKVIEFFKDFPEPYRQKAINRFSKRNGLNRWDFFRDTAMQEEMKHALTGSFLEDKREHEEMIRENERLEWEKEKSEAEANFEYRDVPAWERQVLKVIPLQPGETMAIKLCQAGTVSALGVTFLLQWIKFRRSNPQRLGFYSSLVGSIGLFGMCEAAAAARLMDFGIFDRSVDKRHVLDKALDQLKSDFRLLEKSLEGKPRS